MSGENLAAVAAAAAEGASKPAAEQTKPADAASAAPASSPAQQQPATPPPAAARVAPDPDSLRAEGRAAERAYRNEIEDLCALAGQPQRARAFIDADTPVAEVRRQLLDARATADAGQQIQTQHAGGVGAAPQKGALAARMTKLTGTGA